MPEVDGQGEAQSAIDHSHDEYQQHRDEHPLERSEESRPPSRAIRPGGRHLAVPRHRPKAEARSPSTQATGTLAAYRHPSLPLQL